MATCELYPGAAREFTETRAAYSVFAEADLERLAGLGLEKFVTNPSNVQAFVDGLTRDRVFPGIEHFGDPRVYLIEGDNGSKCVVKPFPDYYDPKSGLWHMATQELLHEAFEHTTGHDAARVYAHIGLSRTKGTGFAIMEYVDAYTYRQIEGPIDHTNFLTKAVTSAVVAVRHRAQREAMLPQGTTLRDYTELVQNAGAARDKALQELGVTLRQERYMGCGNWDYNRDNLLCGVDDEGVPTLTVIDQSADMDTLMNIPF
jgi:hypothetical protein